jgi:hypothetical protein
MPDQSLPMHRLSTFVLASLLAASVLPVRAQTQAADGPPRLALPRAMVPNAGQWPDHVRFAMAGGPHRLWVERDALLLEQKLPDGGREILRLRVLDAVADSAPAGEHALAGTYSYFLGDASGQWRNGLAAHDCIRWRAIRPGIDLLLTTAGAAPEYLLDLAPGADVTTLRFRCEGADRLETGADGSLRIHGRHGCLVQTPPRAFRLGRGGGRSEAAVRFRIDGPDTYGFTAEPIAADERLCIDPMLQWSTYVGGSGYEWCYAVARVADGSVIVAGESTSSDFPTTPGAYDTTYNGAGPPTTDVVVARITANGQGVIYATYLGGSTSEKPYGVACNAAGEATIAGATQSGNFPTTTGAHDRILGGPADAFVARLTADGTSLVFSTFLGGSDSDEADDVALDPSGDAWVTGVTASSTFPTTPGAVQSTRAGTSDAFVARIAANGTQLLAATLLGGNDGDVAKSIAVSGGDVYIGGVTSSPDFPTTPGAMQRLLRGSSDAFLAILRDNCQTLAAATLCGGSSGDVGEGVGVGAAGLPLLTGVTSSSDFPVTAGAYDTVASGASDAFAVAFLPTLGQRYGTLLGGSGGDVAKAVFGLPDGTTIVSGQCSSTDFPTTPGAVLPTGSGSADAFVARLAVDGSGLLAGTLFGGGGSDGGEDADGQDASAVAITGVTNSRDLPLGSSPWLSIQNGTNDAFATVLDLGAPGVLPYGVSTPACSGSIRASVTRWPAAGAADFAFACANAPPVALGVLALGFTPAPGFPVFGIAVFVDPTQPLLTAMTFADALGLARVPLPLTHVAAGTHFYVQWVWFNPPGCGAPGSLSASDALDVMVQ